METKIESKTKFLTASTAEILETKYKQLQQESLRYGEANDCTVVATAMLFDLDYNTAHKMLFDLGRIAGSGFHMERLEARHKHRLSKRQHIKQPNGSKYTVLTLPRVLPIGKYFVYTSGHVLAMINGTVYDWTEDRKHRVTSITEVDSMLEQL